MHLLPYTSILLVASATYLPLQPRVDPCTQDIPDEAVQLDGPSADGTAGIGAEFETFAFYFENPKCSSEDTNAARKQIVAERTGLNWELTGDTGSGIGKVNAEYILNGKNIKVGSGDGAKAGKAWADDLIAWKPWTGTPPNTVDIANSNCNPWRIATPASQKPEKVPWFPQITAPMPLEALYSLMKENEDDPVEKNILDGTNYLSKAKIVVVNQKYFQSNKNGIDQSKVTDDVLGFCSLVLSYAKGASIKLEPDRSPKQFFVFMPRTEFNTLYEQVKSKLPGDLFSLFNSLACYQTNRDGSVEVDSNYCSGSVENPISNDKFSALSYTNTAPTPHVTVNIKDWIEGIGRGDPSPDALSKFDQSIDSSIGGLGTNMEKMYNSQRSVPLFEFRDLQDITTSGVEDFMNKVDSAIQDLHNKFGKAPSRKRDIPANCTRPNDPAATNPTSSAPAQLSSSTPTPTSTGTPTCVGNQVQGSCIAGTLPSSKPYSGYQGPSCLKADGSAGSRPRLNATVAQAAASQYCQTLIDEKIVLSEGKSNPSPAIAKGKAEDGHQMSLTVMYFKNSCPEDHSASTLDFAAIGAETCFQYLYTAIETSCSQDSTWQDYDPEWTLQGGVFGGGCGLFSISGD